ncbi:MAG: hypothetical protein HY908_13450, partial [Myxococcales bacterium]|nr:hypothetical protein [Myxococcales bacterium]
MRPAPKPRALASQPPAAAPTAPGSVGAPPSTERDALASGPPTELDGPRPTARDAGPAGEQVSSEEPDYGLPTARDGASSERTVREPAPLDTTLRSEPSARPAGRADRPRASDRNRAHLAATMPSATDEVTRGRRRLAELEGRAPVVARAPEPLTTTLASEVPVGSERARPAER